MQLNKNKKGSENIKEDVERRVKDLEGSVGNLENEILQSLDQLLLPKIEADTKNQINESVGKIKDEFNKHMRDDFKDKEKRLLQLEGVTEDMRNA